MERIKQLINAAGQSYLPNEVLLRIFGELYGRQNLQSAAIAAGTTTTKVKTVNVMAFVIGGALGTKAATDDAITLATNTLSATQVGGYVLAIDGAGTLYNYPLTPSTTLAGIGSVGWPVIPVSQVAFGLVLINLTSAATFTAGTTAVSAANVQLVNLVGPFNPLNLF